MKTKTNALWHQIRLYGMHCLLLMAFVVSCKKDQTPQPLTQTTLSKNSLDLLARLDAIKQRYYDQKLNMRFIANDDKGITWSPDWEKPRLEIVNDSVSYVFYPMIGTVNRDGKLARIQEIGAATYLMVKNEKDFYKAFYYLPEDKLSKDRSADKAEVIMRHFTGNLLLSSLNGKGSYLLDYVNGRLSESYKKNQIIGRKLQSVGGATSYWQTDCQTVIRHCTFVSAGYSYCGGEVMVIYSYNCYWPQPMCGVTFYMTDSSEEEVCQQVWYPDPPTDSGSGGSDGPDLEDPGEDYELLVTFDSIRLSRRLDCFNSVPTNSNTIYSAKICADLPVNSNPKALLNENREPGHTFLELTKTNGSTTVTETIGFYPENYIKAAFQLSVNSMIVDNQTHPYDASLAMTVSASQFEQMLATAKEKSANNYSMTGYNCTTFALDVFNSGRASNNQLVVSNTVPPNTVFSSYGKTPNGLYNTIKTMADNNVSGASVVAGTGKVSTNCGP